MKNAKSFIRISGDSPYIDPKLIDEVISKSYKKLNKFDLVTNAFPRTFPKGQSIEIINTNKLKSILKKINKSEKENVTEHFYKNSKKFNIMNIKSKSDFSHIKITVDYKKDLNLIKKIDKRFNNIVSYKELCKFILKSKDKN